MKRIINYRPLLILGLSLIFGIVFGAKRVLGIVYPTYIYAGATLTLAVIFIVFNIRNLKTIVDILLISVMLITGFICGSLLVRAHIAGFDKIDIEPGRYLVEGRVKEASGRYDNENRGVFIILIIDNVSFRTESETVFTSADANIFVYFGAADESTVDIGDYISFNSYVSNYTSIYNDKINSDMILENIKFKASVDLSEIKIGAKKLSLFERINLEMRDTLKAGMAEDEFSIAYALLTGKTDLMPGSVLNSFRLSGVAHIFAVSGLHISVLAVVLNFLLRKLKTRYVKSAIIAVVLILYSGICGFSSSCVRSAIMCLVLIAASDAGKKYDRLNSLILSGIITVLINPFYLFEAGFLLSYTCVLSIIILMPVIRRLLGFLPQRVSNSLSLIIAVQIGVLPLTLKYFGQSPLISLISNFLLVPIVSFIFIMLLFTTLIAMIPIGWFIYILKVPEFFIRYLKHLMLKINWGKLPFIRMKMGSFVAAYYAVLILMSDFVNLNRNVRLTLIVFFAALFIGGVIVLNMETDPDTLLKIPALTKEIARYNL